jgi:hypothetical protein
MQPALAEAQAVASKRGARRTPSSTAKLDAILAEVQAGANRQHRLESSIDKMADAVRDLAVSSVRYEEKVLQLEHKTTKEIEAQGQQLIELKKSVDSIAKVVDGLETQRQTQQFWFRTIFGYILVPVVIGVFALGSFVYYWMGM